MAVMGFKGGRKVAVPRAFVSRFKRSGGRVTELATPPWALEMPINAVVPWSSLEAQRMPPQPPPLHPPAPASDAPPKRTRRRRASARGS